MASHSQNPSRDGGPRGSLRTDARGAVTSEYVILVGTVSLAMILGLLTIGPSLVRSFELTRNVLISPFP